MWYSKNANQTKYRQLYYLKNIGAVGASQYVYVEENDGTRRPASATELAKGTTGLKFWSHDNMTSQRPPGDFPLQIGSRVVRPNRGYWKTGEVGMERLARSQRLTLIGNTLRYVRYFDDFKIYPLSNAWSDTVISGFGTEKLYIVQTLPKVIERCILMATDPGDLVLDPTCGSGTTAFVAEQWGATVDYNRHEPSGARTRKATRDGGSLPILPSPRQLGGRPKGRRTHR